MTPASVYIFNMLTRTLSAGAAASTDLRVRGASSPDITTRDKDQPGDDKVMKSTDPSVLQGPQGAGGSGGNASKQPRDGSTGDIAR